MKALKGLYELTIWHPDSIPLEEYKYRNLKRVMFPIIDVILILAGISAAYYGVPAISEFFARWVVDSFATLLTVCGFLAFMGVVFPRLWSLEIAAKSIVLGLLVTYVTSLFILTRVGEGNRGFVLCIAAIAIAVVAWRLSLLSSEWQDRRIAETKAKQAEEDHLG